MFYVVADVHLFRVISDNLKKEGGVMTSSQGNVWSACRSAHYQVKKLRSLHALIDKALDRVFLMQYKRQFQDSLISGISGPANS